MATFMQIAANRANAQLSTGPRTVEGKNQSRCNSYKHGFKALLIPCIEDSREVEASRERWLDCFPGDDEVTKTLADMSFRAKRRLVNVSDADDAAIVARVEKVAEIHYLEQRAAIDDGWKAFRQDPGVGVNPMLQSEIGCRRVLGILDQMLNRCLGNVWSREDGRHLLGFEDCDSSLERGRLDDFADLFEETFARDMQRVDADSDDSTHAVLLGDSSAKLDVLKARCKLAQAELEARVKAVWVAVQKKAALIEGCDVRTLHVKRDEAKFDASDEGRLRRRYLAEAQRDFLKALAEARRVSAQVTAAGALKLKQAEEKLKPGSSSAKSEGSPNEAKSDYDDDDDYEGDEGSDIRQGGPRRGRRRSS